MWSGIEFFYLCEKNFEVLLVSQKAIFFFGKGWKFQTSPIKKEPNFKVWQSQIYARHRNKESRNKKMIDKEKMIGFYFLLTFFSFSFVIQSNQIRVLFIFALFLWCFWKIRAMIDLCKLCWSVIIDCKSHDRSKKSISEAHCKKKLIIEFWSVSLTRGKLWRIQGAGRIPTMKKCWKLQFFTVFLNMRAKTSSIWGWEMFEFPK